jgi:magnesium transporter
MDSPQITVMAYSKDSFMSRKVADLESALQFAEYPTVWVNVTGFSAIPKLEKLLDLRGFPSRLSSRPTAHPRVVIFPDYVFVLLYQVYETQGGLKREKTALILKDNLVITVQEREGDVFNPVREGIRRGEGLFRERGSDYLLFALLEAVVGNYVPIIERISSQMEELEGRILAKPDAGLLRRIHGLRRDILFMRRTIFPLLEAFRKLRLEGGSFFRGEGAKFMEELHEHVAEVLDILEGQRELANSLVELYYSTLSTKTNDIIRILTVVSTIFIPLTFITGVYGMNFGYMPELHWRYGYPAALLGMLGISVTMLGYFKKKGWL